MTAETQQERMHGMDALRTMVDTNAKLRRLSEWRARVEAMLRSIASTESELGWQYEQALRALKLAVEIAPGELEIRVSDGAVQWLDDAEGKLSKIETDVREVLDQIGDKA